ncbi:hypothetical protein [Komagataeibacter saccharivorans]|uniref:hypothetical protein n=1 Tax=Komagataeibacter saccharivorans TaxID=265959 RepID=UPI0011AF507F|nr:hypothetical protein [Komagataeibacter saccharivorans]
MKVGDFQDFPVPEPQYKIPITKSAEEPKLRANLLNTAAGSCLSLGVLSPLAASFFNLTANRIPTHIVILGVAFWLGMAYFRHQRAQAVLGGLRE